MIQEEMSSDDIYYLQLWWPICTVNWTICAIVLEGIMRNFSVKLI